MQPDYSIKVASFNVGSLGDWQNLYCRARWKNKLQKDFVSSPDFKVQKEAFYAFEKAEAITQAMVLQDLAQKVKIHLGGMIREFNPHIICLQEYFFQNRLADNAHLPIKQILESNGYTIVGEANPGSGRIDDKAIAYQTKAFECLKVGFAFKEGMQEPALYADLKLASSGIIIRAASDHVSGFNGVQQKNKERNNDKVGPKAVLPAAFQERLKFLEQNPCTCHGDIALDRSLNGLEQDDVPDIIVFGLDANATSKESSHHKNERLHPKRMRLFKIYGYAMDHVNQNATILDGNDWYPRKYDYICAKGNRKHDYTVTVSDHIFQEINHPTLLREPGAIMSDHLPVLSSVQIFKNKKDGCWIS